MTIHEASNDARSLRLKWRSEVLRYIDEYLPVFKAKNKNKIIKLKFATSITRRKGSKFTTNVLAKIQMSGVTMVLYLTSKYFTL